MQYRTIARTGDPVSVIGLGLEHLDGQPYAPSERTIHAALDQGINIMDLFMPGADVRQNIGRALKGRRDKVFLQGMIGSVDLNEQYDISRDLTICKRYFEDLLRYLQTDYIDCGMLFFMDSDEAMDEVEANGILDYVRSLRQNGTIRLIGASSHNPHVARKLVERGWVDMMLFSINPAFDLTADDTYALNTLETGFELRPTQGIRSARTELYQLCEQNDVSLTVMKSLGAGKLLSPDHTPFSKPLTVTQCIHYALSRPAVVSVMVGCRDEKQIGEAVAYLEATDEAKDYSWIYQENHATMEGSCVYCNHCQPCPVEIDISTVNKYLDIARLDEQNVPPSLRRHYRELPARGADCIQCGSCEARCPFGVPIIENMARAEELLG